jgi:hypothetical protein
MGDLLDSLTDKHMEWAMAQKIFFVSTAPLSQNDHINCSPKGGDCFQFLVKETFIYADYTGSGNETIAHVNENGRILIMFCAFEGPPRIMRLHGWGTAILPGNPEFEELGQKLPDNHGLRSVIHVAIKRASVSCGFSVPLYDFVKQRNNLDKWADTKGSAGLVEYRKQSNQTSVDGLPGYGQLLEMDDSSTGESS